LTDVADRLQTMATSDPTLAPLVAFQIEALKAAGEPVWERAVPSFGVQSLIEGKPLLDGQSFAVESSALRGYWGRVRDIARRSRADQAPGLESIDELTLIALTEAAIRQDAAAISAIADGIDTDPDFLVTLGQLLALPLLRNCGRKAAAVVSATTWQAGYCPVCAAWPTLAEIRGLDRERWLRCGRCGSSWSFRQLVCVYCGNDDHASQGYLAADIQRDARRAEFCEECGGDVKAVATFGALGPDEVLAQDMATVEIDLAALDRGYGRPDAPAYPLKCAVMSSARRGWLSWPH